MKTDKRKAAKIAAAALAIAAAILSLAGIKEYADRKAWEKAASVVYPMTNQNITWTGAGYSGIYAGGAGK